MADVLHQISKSLDSLTDNEHSFREPRYLLAVSGGLDSMVMAHAFHRMELKIGVAHFNFQLREDESEKDADLVREFCDRYNIPFYIRIRDTHQAAAELNLSIQETARYLRYKFFEDISREKKYDYICTAHHANDQLETFFIHLIRGSGLKGLTGIPARRKNILRPMLQTPLSELQEYAKKNDVEFRQDVTNLSDDYLRNRIRHHITGPLIEWDPNNLSNALRSISYLKDIQVYMDRSIEIFERHFVHRYSTVIKWIDLDDPELSDPQNRFILREYLRISGLYPDSIRDILVDTESLRTGSQYEGAGMDAFYDRGKLWLVHDDFFEDWATDDHIEIKTDGSTVLPGGDEIVSGTQPDPERPDLVWSFALDPGHIRFPLYVRHRMPGDRIWAGNPPYFRKSLKKLLAEKNIPLPFKDRLYLLVDAKDEIVSVLGFIDSPRFTLTDKKGDQEIWYYSRLWKKLREV